MERTIRFDGQGPLELGPGQAHALRFLVEDQTDAATTEVDFALEGSAADSSLSEVAVPTDSSGVAQTTLRAGTVPTSFRVRASVQGAANVYVDVSVAAAFGSIGAKATYDGARAITDVELLVYAGTQCADLDPFQAPPPDRIVALPEVSAPEGERTWTFEVESVAVGATYSLLILGRAAGDGIVAAGCTGGVELEPATEASSVSVPLTDLAYSAQGQFAVETRLELGDAIGPRLARLLSAPDLQTSDDGQLALLVLGRIGDSFSADEARAAKWSAQQSPDLSGRLRDAFAQEPIEKGSRLGSLEEELRTALSSLTLDSTLRFGDTTRGVHDEMAPLTFQHELTGLRFSAAVGPGPIAEHSVSLAEAGVLSIANGTALVEPEGLTLERHSLRFPLGTVALAVLTQTLVPGRGEPSLEELVATALECDAMASWWSSEVGGVCDEDCFDSACRTVATESATAIRTRLMAADVENERLDLEGSALLEDVDGDAVVDAMTDGQWSGEWSGTTPLDVRTSFEGEHRTVE